MPLTICQAMVVALTAIGGHMDEKTVKDALKQLKEASPKRNFKQAVDFIVTLKGLNLKNPEHQMDFLALLPHGKGKKTLVCALIGPESQEEAEKVCDKVILQHKFEDFAKDKKLCKKLAKQYEYFIAQANIMAQVANAFGRVFGPKKKMPNPKFGCVFPPKANLKPLYDKLQKSVRVYAKERPIVQCSVGREDMKDEEIVANALAVYQQVLQHLPQEKNNIKKAYLKFTMSKPVQVG